MIIFIELHQVTIPTKSKSAQEGKRVLIKADEIVSIKEKTVGCLVETTNKSTFNVFESYDEVVSQLCWNQVGVSKHG